MGHLQAVIQAQIVEPGVGTVEHAKAVLAWFDLKIGLNLAVDSHEVAEEINDPWRLWIGRDRIVQLAVSIEHADRK